MEREKILVFANISEFLAPPKKSSVFEMYKKVNKKFYSLFFIPKLKKLQKKNDVLVICSDIETQEFISKKGLETKLILEYETKREVSKIEKDVTSILDNSNFSKRIKELTRLRNTSLFDLAEESVFSYLVASLEIYFTIEKAIEIEKPDRIISIDRNRVFGSLAEMAANKKGVNMRYLKSVSLPSKIKTKTIDKSFPILVKKFRKGMSLKSPKNLQKGNKDRNHKRKIVIFTGSSHHVGMIVPWARKLSKNPENNVLVVGLFDDKEKYGENINFEQLKNYATEIIFQNTRKKIRRLNRIWDQLKKDTEFKKSLKYKDIDLWRIMKDEFTILFLNFFPRAFEYFEVMLNAIETEDPDLIVTLNDRNMFGKSAALAGKFKGKKALWIQHGVMGNVVRKPSIADKIAVFGNYDRRFLIENGIEKERIILTGQPRFDMPFKKKFSKAETCRKLGIDPKKKIVIFTTQLEYPTQEPAIIETLESIKEISDLQIIFKLHPRDYPDLPDKLTKKHGVHAIIVKNIDIYEILNICDLMITEDSTSWLDAFFLGKPIITMNLGYHRNPIASEIMGSAVGIHKKGELKRAIIRILKDTKFRKNLEKKRRENIYEFIYKRDGKAIQRVNDLIEKMATK